MTLRFTFSLCLMISFSSVALLAGRANATNTISFKKKRSSNVNKKSTKNMQKEKESKLFYMKVGLPVCIGILLLCAAGYYKYAQGNTPILDGGENHSSARRTYNEEKRIVRVNKKKVSAVIPVIFRQTLEALERLTDDEINGLKDNLQKEIDEDKDTFLESYNQREWKIDINKGKYIGHAMMRFKDDPKNKDYFYVACLVKVKKFSDKNQNIDQIKKEISEDMTRKLQTSLDNHVVAEQM